VEADFYRSCKFPKTVNKDPGSGLLARAGGGKCTICGGDGAYSKSEDNASGYRDLLPNNFDDRNFWGPSTFDTRHVMVINAVYGLPVFKDRSRLSGKLLGGWQNQRRIAVPDGHACFGDTRNSHLAPALRS